MRWALYGLVALLVTAVVGAALFPLSLALRLADAPIVGTASGTVWRGEVAGASVAGVPVGEVGIQARLWPTLAGRPAAALSVSGPRGTGTADALVRDGVVTVSALDAVIPADRYGLTGPFGAPVAGTVTVRGEAALGPDGACQSADLDIETTILQDAAARLGQPGPVLVGPVTCEDGTLVARLAGETEATGSAKAIGATALVRLRPGAYVTELTLIPGDPRAGLVLTRYGFRRTPEGYTTTTRGTY